MIQRTFDAAFLNRVANHPDVRPWLGLDANGSTESVIDFSPVMQADLAYGLIVPDAGGFLVVRLGDNECEIHTMFLPDKRGALAYQAAREALDVIFAGDCERLYTQLPSDNKAARLIALRHGFEVIEPRPSPWRACGGEGDDAVLTKEKWRQRRARAA